MEKKLILDACCGGRMFWYDKNNPDALYMDVREVEKGAFQNGWNPNWCVKPDVVADFRSIPFPDNSFKLVVYDPPHLTSGSMKSVINKKYGLLNKDTWKQDIIDGFNECWRVLDDYGTLIFKWNEANIKAKELLRSFPVEPLFGDFTGKTGKTIWVTFMKMPGHPDSTSDEALPIADVGKCYYGVYDEDGELLHVHQSQVGADKYRKSLEKMRGYPFYVDEVTVWP